MLDFLEQSPTSSLAESANESSLGLSTHTPSQSDDTDDDVGIDEFDEVKPILCHLNQYFV